MHRRLFLAPGLRAAARPRRGTDVLVVCTGNICRSPYVAAVLANALPELRVASAGTAAVVGRGPVSPVLAAIDELDLPEPPLARQLHRRMVREARLVLTMTHAQRGEVGTMAPRATARAFTLKELARAAADFVPSASDTSERLSELMAHAGSAIAQSTRDHDDDLADPYGGPLDGYTSMMREAEVAMRAITAALGGRSEG